MPNVRPVVSLLQLRRPDCTCCSLCDSTVNVCIMGRGNTVNPDIVLIGEAPGEAESRTGLPFMGRSGKALQQMIDELGMSDRVYITNVCKCRPPNNRKPTPSEIKTCGVRYLDFELKLIKPTIVVLLGRTPIDYYFGTPFVRGLIYRSRGLPFRLLPTWHPAYGLRAGPQIMNEIRQHLKASRDFADLLIHSTN